MRKVTATFRRDGLYSYELSNITNVEDEVVVGTEDFTNLRTFWFYRNW